MPLSLRLRQALEEAAVSQRELARRVVARTGGATVENERRQIGKYLQGKHSPEPDRARLYAELLGKPADYFIDEQPTRTVDLLGELRAMVAALTEAIAVAEVVDRLEALEAQVAEIPTADDLKRGLESLRRSIVRASRGTGEDPPARSAAK